MFMRMPAIPHFSDAELDALLHHARGVSPPFRALFLRRCVDHFVHAPTSDREAAMNEAISRAITDVTATERKRA
jgi:hypothetical protein